MQKLNPNDPETMSADIVSENIKHLKALFPEALVEGKVDFDVLKQLLGGAVDEREEKYGLHWFGKRNARHRALTTSSGTLLPCPEDSLNWDSTQHLMIEGDNLEVLKLLQKSYTGKVKVIYIDPPYNTGNDFVYEDSFHDTYNNYLKQTGQLDGEAPITSNTESSGRFHTDWLNMMYPRLELAKRFLTQDGFLVVSIDDVELPNLQLLLREVFGEEHGVAVLVWDRNRKNDAKLFSVGHEYMVVVARDKGYLKEVGTKLRERKPGIDEAKSLYEALMAEYDGDVTQVQSAWREYFRKLDADDPKKPLGRFSKLGSRGPFRDDGDISWPGGGGPQYEVLHPITGKPCKRPAGGWVYPTLERFKEAVADGQVVFGPDETTLPRQLRFLFEGEGQVMISVNFSYAQTATVDFVELMGCRAFDNPKYWEDLRRLVAYLSGPTDTVMDFFAGSGTLGHAVYAQNRLASENRRFILVQLPQKLDITKSEQKVAAEFCDSLSKPRLLTEVTKERLRRAAQRNCDGAKRNLDCGFRVFKQAESNLRPWDTSITDLETDLLAAVSNLREDRSELDVLFELLLKLGLDLCVPIEEREIESKTVYSVGAGSLLVCLAPIIERSGVEPLALGIVEWFKELEPAGESSMVFLDSAFADDVSKTNMTAILGQNGLLKVRSL